MSTQVTGGRRTIVVMAVVAVVCLGAGLLLSRPDRVAGQGGRRRRAPDGRSHHRPRREPGHRERDRHPR